jgi:nucleoside-diphosphate-sugar epimerase
LIDALFAAMKFEKKLGFQIFNIGTGKSFSLNSMVAEIRKYFPNSAPPRFIENPVRENYILSQCADISKIREILNWSPRTDLAAGIKLQIENLEIGKIRETSSDGF